MLLTGYRRDYIRPDIVAMYKCKPCVDEKDADEIRAAYENQVSALWLNFQNKGSKWIFDAVERKLNSLSRKFMFGGWPVGNSVIGLQFASGLHRDEDFSMVSVFSYCTSN
jgi:hypothetical protein